MTYDEFKLLGPTEADELNATTTRATLRKWGVLPKRDPDDARDQKQDEQLNQDLTKDNNDDT